MAISYVQSTTGVSSGSTVPTVSTPFGSATTAGNLVVVTIADDSGLNNGVTGVTDSLNNTYTQVFATHGTSSMQMWYAILASGAAGMTINVTWNVINTPGVTFVVQEFSGINQKTPLDNSKFSAATTSVNVASPAVSNDLSQALLIGAGIHAGASAAWTIGANYTNMVSNDVANRSVAMESRIVTNISSQTATFTIASSLEWIGAIAIFNPANSTMYNHLSVGDGMSRSEVAN